MKRIPSVALGRQIAGLALASTVGSLSAAVTDTYYVSDQLATTTAVADAAGEIASLETDAFGSPVGGGEQAARYTGKPYDADIGAYVFPFRNYRSDEARWMSADPSGFPDGSNAYIYSRRPYREIDATGLALSDLVGEGPWDEAGAHIWEQWLVGNGATQIYDEIADPAWGLWGDYMRANGLLDSHIRNSFVADAIGRSSGGSFSVRNHATIEDGYFTGYECLHGSNATVGDFFLSATTTVTTGRIDGQNYRDVTYSSAFAVWHDIIDPNPSAGWVDQVGSLLQVVSPVGTAYTIRIKWQLPQMTFRIPTE